MRAEDCQGREQRECGCGEVEAAGEPGDGLGVGGEEGEEQTGAQRGGAPGAQAHAEGADKRRAERVEPHAQQVWQQHAVAGEPVAEPPEQHAQGAIVAGARAGGKRRCKLRPEIGGGGVAGEEKQRKIVAEVAMAQRERVGRCCRDSAERNGAASGNDDRCGEPGRTLEQRRGQDGAQADGQHGAAEPEWPSVGGGARGAKERREGQGADCERGAAWQRRHT